MTPLAAHPTSSAYAVTPSQKTAPVHEFHCTFTHDVRRKNSKRWKDGYLKHHTFNNRLLVYDETRNFVQSGHQTHAIGDIYDGAEFSLDVILVQVGEQMGSTETNLSDVVKKKSPRCLSPQSPPPSHRRLFATPSSKTRNAPSLRSIIAPKATPSKHDRTQPEGIYDDLFSQRPCKKPRNDANHKPLAQIINAGDQSRPGTLVMAALQQLHQGVKPLTLQEQHESVDKQSPAQFVDLTDKPPPPHASSCPTATLFAPQAHYSTQRAAPGLSEDPTDDHGFADGRPASRGGCLKAVVHNETSTGEPGSSRRWAAHTLTERHERGSATNGQSSSAQLRDLQTSHEMHSSNKCTRPNSYSVSKHDRPVSSLDNTKASRQNGGAGMLDTSLRLPLSKRGNVGSMAHPGKHRFAVTADNKSIIEHVSSTAKIGPRSIRSQPIRSLKLRPKAERKMLCQGLNNVTQTLQLQHSHSPSQDDEEVSATEEVVENDSELRSSFANGDTRLEDEGGSLCVPESPPQASEAPHTAVDQHEAAPQSQILQTAEEVVSFDHEVIKSSEQTPLPSQFDNAGFQKGNSDIKLGLPRRRAAKSLVLDDMHTTSPVLTCEGISGDGAAMPRMDYQKLFTPIRVSAARCKGLRRTLSDTINVLTREFSIGPMPDAGANAASFTYHKPSLRRRETIGHAIAVSTQSASNQDSSFPLYNINYNGKSTTNDEQGTWTPEAWDLFGECPAGKRNVLSWDYDEAVVSAD